MVTGIVLLGLAIATYSRNLQAGFVWDDDAYVTENQALHDYPGLTRIWTDPTASVQYYPLTFTTFWVQYQIWGLSPLPYHLLNVVLHATGSLLLWLLLHRLSVPGALLASLIFAVHPVHVESVAWITERKNVLSGVFFMAALLAWEGAVGFRDATRLNVRLYLVAAMLFACALLSKTATCVLPVTILIITWWKSGRVRARTWLSVAPLVLMAICAGLATVWVESHHVAGEAEGREWLANPVDKLLVAGRALWFYLYKLVLPVDLMFIYPRWQVDRLSPGQYLLPSAWAALLVALWIMRRRVSRGPLAAMLYFTAALMPALGFVNVYFMRYSWVADHFQYLASIGPIVLFSSILTSCAQAAWTAASGVQGSSGMAQLAGVPVLIILGALSWNSSHRFHDMTALWHDTLTSNPEAWMAHSNLGNLLSEKGDLRGAIRSYERALAINPNDTASHNMLGNALVELGRFDDAERHFLEAIRLAPRSPFGHANLGRCLTRAGKPALAVEHYLAALRIQPDDPMLLTNMGNAFLAQGNIPAAMQAYANAIRANPSLPQPHLAGGIAQEQAGDLRSAEEHYRQAIALAPDMVSARQALASLLSATNRASEAIEQLTAGARAEPSNTEVGLLLADTLLIDGQMQVAIEQYQRVIRIDPASPVASAKLAWILATHNDPGIRDGASAVQLAETAVKKAHSSPVLLDVLAAAYAEAGRYQEAAATARRAIAAAAQLDPEAVHEMQARLALYERGQPFRADPLEVP